MKSGRTADTTTSTDKWTTVEKVVALLSDKGIKVSVEEAAAIHEFLKKLADISVECYLSENSTEETKNR